MRFAFFNSIRWRPLALVFTLTLTLVSFVLAAPLALAKEVQLFNSYGNQVRDYRQQLDNLQPGDEFVFEQGKFRFKLIKHLGSGSTTEVYQVKVISPKRSKVKTMALRLPINMGSTNLEQFGHRTPFARFIDYYTNKKERNMFIRRGIRVPKIYHQMEEQFAAVELVQPDFSLQEFMYNKANQPAKVLQEAENKLYEFVLKTTDLEVISDFRGDQLHYDVGRGEWILLDYTKGTRALNPFKLSFNPKGDSVAVYIDYDKLSDADTVRAQQIQQNIFSIYNQNQSRTGVIGKRCSDFFRHLLGRH